MFLIVGLGNPGEEYIGTKHNIGREIVEKLVKKYELDFEYDKKSNALVAQGKIEPASAKGSGEAKKAKVILALPETFMNKSGEAVKKLVSNVKHPSSAKAAADKQMPNVFVVHDDIDLPIGKMKISFNKSSAGHKGVENVIKNLKTEKFYRIRIGIGQKKKTKEAMDVVLKKFSAKEAEELKKVKKNAQEAIICAVTESPQKAMTLYNQ